MKMSEFKDVPLDNDESDDIEHANVQATSEQGHVIVDSDDNIISGHGTVNQRSLIMMLTAILFTGMHWVCRIMFMLYYAML
jgi:hypothetical protein